MIRNDNTLLVLQSQFIFILWLSLFQAPRWGSSVAWTFASLKQTGNTTRLEELPLNSAMVRGGVRISSWREAEGEVVSQLEMVAITAHDIGNYTCSLPGELAATASATVRLHIVSELQEPVINGQPSWDCTLWGTLSTLLITASLSFERLR